MQSTESDPNGVAPHEPGAKLDAGKPWGMTVLRGFGPAIVDRFAAKIDYAGFSTSQAIILALTCKSWTDSRDVITALMIEARGLEGVLRVGTFGAQKYSKYGFLEVENATERYYEAGGRHLAKWLNGEDYDSDSRENHLDIWLWNLLAEDVCDR